MRFAALALVVALAGCGGLRAGSQFRPAKSAQTYPAVKEAFRVKEVPPECPKIGVVHAKSIPGLAETAAENGATAYIVRSDEFETVYETRNNFSGRTTRVEKNRFVWADVYRCEEER